MRTFSATVVAVLLLVMSAVGTVGQEDASTPNVPVGQDVSYFTGTEECASEVLGSTVVDGVMQSQAHYTCETVTTDPRFTGTEEIDLMAYVGGAAGGLWTAEAVLNQGEGSWRGEGLGVWDAGASPLGTPGLPFNYGEMTYVGEGSYEGLVLHYYLAGTDEELAFMGWIAPSE